jgi:transposase-like protein
MALLKIYTDEEARAHLERLNWPNGPVCPHCGTVNEATKLKGKSTRPGVYKCRPCQKPFSVTVGTVFERSKIALNTWVHAVDIYTASKKGFSAHQLHRTLNVTYKTAWFMAHRIREAMTEPKGPANPIGGEGKIVEADETYFGENADEKPMPAYRKGRPYQKGSRGPRNKRAIVSLVERGGKVRSFHVDRADSKTIAEILYTNVQRLTVLHTDESRLYTALGKDFASHETVKHAAGEYVRGKIHIKGIVGKRLMYRRPDEAKVS